MVRQIALEEPTLSWVILGEGIEDSTLAGLWMTLHLVQPKVKLAVLGDVTDLERCDRWLARGAEAYLRSTVAPLGAFRILLAAAESQVLVIDQMFVNVRVARQAQLRMNLMPTKGQLTRREQEVLTRLRLGMSNSAIASTLFITEGTVEFHVSNILAKLAVTSRTEAVVRANALGL